MHLNWVPSYGLEIDSNGSALKSLARDASQAVGGGSLGIGYFQSKYVWHYKVGDSNLSMNPASD